MFFFGFIWGVVNLFVMGAILNQVFSWDTSRRRTTMWTIFKVLLSLILIPIAAFLIVMPFFGGWIVLPIAQHVCHLTISTLDSN